MSNGEKYVNIVILVEGQTEKVFIEAVLAPYLAMKNIFMTPVIFDKKGEKGGDVKFSRAKKDISRFMKQVHYDAVTTLFDYYGVTEWPGVNSIAANSSPRQIYEDINRSTIISLKDEFPDINFEERFIPFVAVHEFESLLFSDSSILASKLGITENSIVEILHECGEPEAINNSLLTAPSKRLEKLATRGFKKTVTGIDIAREIGIDKMREKCPNFNAWLEKIELL